MPSTGTSPSSQCSIALSGSGPGTLKVSAVNAATATATLPTNSLAPDAIVLSTQELDFGIVSAASPAATQTITVTNLSATSQTFTSAKDGGATTAYSFAETASDRGPDHRADAIDRRCRRRACAGRQQLVPHHAGFDHLQFEYERRPGAHRVEDRHARCCVGRIRAGCGAERLCERGGLWDTDCGRHCAAALSVSLQ